MKRRVWGVFHTIKGDDLTKVGEFYKEAIEGLSGGFGQGRMGAGFRLVPGSSASKVKLTAGWAVLETPDNKLHLVQVADSEVDFSGLGNDTYDLVATVTEAAETTETITPPPQTLPNGNDNPFYDARFSSYSLDVAVKQTVTLTAQTHPHTAGANEVIVGEVVWDGSTITQSNITELIGPPVANFADDSITAAMLNPDTAGAGLIQEASGALAVNPDGSTLEIVSDQVRIKAGGVTDNQIGNRTVDDGQAPTDDSGALTDLLSELSNRIRAITGKANWFDDPRINLEGATGKGQTEAISGQWTFNTAPHVPLTPSADADATSKKYVDDTVNAGSAALDAHKSANPLDHPDGSVTDAKIGNRTIDDTNIPAGDTDTLTNLLSGLANRITAITGELGWSDDPVASIAEMSDNMPWKGNDETITGQWTFNGDLTTMKRLRLTATDNASLTSTLQALQIGDDGSYNLIADGNDIMARNNGAASTLHLNSDGGLVSVGSGATANGASPIRVGSEFYKVWHEGNDGAGSGLDADLLDGHEAGAFVRTDADSTVTGGAVSMFNSSSSKFFWGVDASHENVEGYGQSGFVGFSPRSGTTDVTDGDLKFDFTNSYWVFDKGPYVGSNEIIHAGNIGSYSSSDADKLDGLDSTQFLRSDVDDEFTGNHLSVNTKLSVGTNDSPQVGNALVDDPGLEIRKGSDSYRLYVESGTFFIEEV